MSDFYRGFPLTQNEAKRYLATGELPDEFRSRVESWMEFGACENCDNVRCMHFVLRDWWDSGIDECDGWCCPSCSELKPAPDGLSTSDCEAVAPKKDGA